MLKDITLIFIGAILAMASNLLTTLVNQNSEKDLQKKDLYSQLNRYGMLSFRILEEIIGHQIWLNYYQRIITLYFKEEQNQIELDTKELLIGEKERIKNIERLVTNLLEIDANLTGEASKFHLLFKRNLQFDLLLDEILSFNLDEQMDIEDFSQTKDIYDLTLNGMQLDLVKKSIQKNQFKKIKKN